MKLRHARYRVEQIGICKWRDRDHALQIAAMTPGLEQPFVRLMRDWSVHLAAAEAQAREWYGAMRTGEIDTARDWEEYAEFERQMGTQSAEFIRQLGRMKEHSPTLRNSRAYRAFIAHVQHDASLLVALLRQPFPPLSSPADDEADKASAQSQAAKTVPAAKLLAAKRFVLERKPGGWTLREQQGKTPDGVL